MMAHKQQLCSTLPMPLVHEQIALQCAKNIRTAAMDMVPPKNMNGAVPVLVEVQRMNDNKSYRYVVNATQGTITKVGELSMTGKPSCPMHGNAITQSSGPLMPHCPMHGNLPLQEGQHHEHQQQQQQQQIVLCDQLARNASELPLTGISSQSLCIAQQAVHVVNDSAWEKSPRESTLNQHFATFQGPAFLLQASTEICGQIAAAMQERCYSIEDHSRSLSGPKGWNHVNGVNSLNASNGSNRSNDLNGYKQPPKENLNGYNLPNGIHKGNGINGCISTRTTSPKLTTNPVPMSGKLPLLGPLPVSKMLSTPMPVPLAMPLIGPVRKRGLESEPNRIISEQDRLTKPNKDTINGTYPLTNAQYPTELQNMFKWNFCNLCHTSMRTVRNACDHYRSRAHDRRISSWLIDQRSKRGKTSEDLLRYIRAGGPSAFYCELCDLKLTSVMHAQQHFFGRRHHLVARHIIKPTGPGYYDKCGRWVRTHIKWLTCELCDVNITSESQMAMHKAGARHRKKLHTNFASCTMPVEGSHMYRITPEGSLTPLNPLGTYMCKAYGNVAMRKAYQMNAAYYCEVCKITVNHMKSVKQHEEGRMHKKKIMRAAFLANLQ